VNTIVTGGVPSLPTVILVVEDMVDLRHCVVAYFQAVGFSVVATADACEALAAIDSGIHIDLIFTDLNMPGAMDGVGLVRWLAVHHPALPVLITSGKSCPQIDKISSHCRFIPKPYVLGTVVRDIQVIIGNLRSPSSA
jgi:CheY-like chemotaxis protein